MKNLEITLLFEFQKKKKNYLRIITCIKKKKKKKSIRIVSC